MLITVNELKKFMPIRAGDVSYDENLTKIISSVSDTICRSCRNTFSIAARTEYLNVLVGSNWGYDIHGLSQDGIVPSAPGALQVSAAPVDTTQPFKVYYDPQRLFPEESLLSAGTITLFPDTGVFYVAQTLYAGENLIKVSYTGGAVVPEPVKKAAIEQCLYEFKRMQYENAGSSTQNNDDATNKTEWAVKSGLLPTVASAVAPYRKLLMGRR